jgi:hypothetical protein
VSAREVLTRIVHQWPRKLAAIGLAVLMWAFVSTTDATIGQRSMLVPITVEGIAPDLVPIGIPEFAEITVTGPTQRLDRLRPESIEAVLDLSGRSGDFAAPVGVSPPQGVTLERVTPAEVLGILERVATRQVPVTVVFLGTPSADVRLFGTPEPATVDVRGRGARLDRVAQAIVAVDVGLEVATVAPYPADAAGRPVDEVTVIPASVTVAMRSEAVLIQREVPLRLLPVVIGGVTEVTPSHATVAVVGPPTLVSALQEVVASAVLPTQRPPPGRYTLDVNLATPSGVAVLDDVSVSVMYVEPPTAP